MDQIIIICLLNWGVLSNVVLYEMHAIVDTEMFELNIF